VTLRDTYRDSYDTNSAKKNISAKSIELVGDIESQLESTTDKIIELNFKDKKAES
jgi:hypothetical protein